MEALFSKKVQNYYDKACITYSTKNQDSLQKFTTFVYKKIQQLEFKQQNLVQKIKQQVRKEFRSQIQNLRNENKEKTSDKIEKQKASYQGANVVTNGIMKSTMEKQNGQKQDLLQIKSDLVKLDKQLCKQKQQIRELQNQMLCYIKQEIEPVQALVKKLVNDSLTKLRQSEENLFSRLQDNQLKYRKLSDTIKPIRNSLKKMQNVLLKKIQTEYANHPKNISQKDFSISASLQSIRVKKVTDFKASNYLNYIKTGQIPINSITKFKIRQIYTKSASIMIGVATESLVLGSKSFKKEITTFFRENIERIGYSSQTGKLCKNNDFQQKGRKIIDGQYIDFCVNTETWKMRWAIRGQCLAQVDIPIQMQQKSIYLMINMRDQGDLVEILIS